MPAKSPTLAVDLSDVLLRSADPFFFVDDEGIIRAWNLGAELLLGWTAEEAVGAEVSMLLPKDPPEIPSEEESEEAIHDSVVAQNYETALKARDGHAISVKITVTLIRDDAGVLLGSAVSARNITREKSLEKELRWRIGEMQMLDDVTQSVQGTLDVERILRVILTAFTAGSGLGFNRAILFLVSGNTLEARLGIGSSNWDEAARTWPRVADKHDLQSVIDFVLTEEDATPSIIQQMAADWRILLDEPENPLALCINEKRSVLWPDSGDPGGAVAARLQSPMFAVVPLLHGGDAIGAVLADNVVTQRPIDAHALRLLRLLAGGAASAISNARLYEKVLRHAGNLKAANAQIREQQDLLLQSRHAASLGRIVAAIQHEVQGPLVPIGGFARLLRGEAHDGSPAAETLDVIIKEADRLELVVKGVASLAKLPTPTLHPVLFGSLVGKVYDVLRADADARSVTLVCDVSAEIEPPHLDHDQWYQALLILTSNALERTPAGGAVTTNLRVEEGRYVVQVADTGEGVPTEDIPRVFKAFYSTQPELNDTGLNVVAEIAQRHFGRVSVESEVGRGTTISIDFPFPEELHRLVEETLAEELSQDSAALLDPTTHGAFAFPARKNAD